MLEYQVFTLEPLHHLERFEQLEAGRVGRNGEYLIVAVAYAYRLYPLGFVRGEVFLGELSAQFPRSLDQLGGEVSPVKFIPAAFSYRAERIGKLGLLLPGARPRASAVLDEYARGRKARQARDGGGYRARVVEGYRRAVLGVSDSGREQPLAFQLPISFMQRQPSRDVARNERGLYADVLVALGVLVWVGGGWHPAREVERAHPVLGGNVR